MAAGGRTSTGLRGEFKGRKAGKPRKSKRNKYGLRKAGRKN